MSDELRVGEILHRMFGNKVKDMAEGVHMMQKVRPPIDAKPMPELTPEHLNNFGARVEGFRVALADLQECYGVVIKNHSVDCLDVTIEDKSDYRLNVPFDDHSSD